MLSLYKLEIFNAVAIEGSFSQAAGRMSLTQPAISQHMRDLEQGLQATLFERGPRGVSLTPAGEILLDYTRCILRLVSEAEGAVQQFEQLDSGQLALGGTPGASVYLLPGWIQRFHQRFGGLAISLQTDTTSGLLKGLVDGKLDLAFVEGELQLEPAINAIMLQEIRLFVVVGEKHPWAGRDTVRLHDLDGQAYISRPQGSQTRSWTDQIFHQYGIQPQMVAEFDNPESIRQVVASGLGFTILAEWGLGQEQAGARLHSLPIEGLDLRRTLKLVWASGGALKPVSRAFLTLLADQYPQLSQVTAGQGDPNLVLPGRESYRAAAPDCAPGFKNSTINLAAGFSEKQP